MTTAVHGSPVISGSRLCTAAAVGPKCQSRRGLTTLRFLDDRAASLNNADQHDRQRQYQQDVDKTAECVGADNTHQPQQQQNYKDCPKHVRTPNLAMGLPLASIAPSDHG